MTPADCRRYAEALIRYRPLGVIGYAAALDMFAATSLTAAMRFAISVSGL